MKTLLIGYDLDRPGQDYSGLIKAIKDIGSWCHFLDSTWLVRTSMTTTEVRDTLVGFMDSNDKLLVAVMGSGYASHGLSDTVRAWLHENL